MSTRRSVLEGHHSISLVSMRTTMIVLVLSVASVLVGATFVDNDVTNPIDPNPKPLAVFGYLPEYRLIGFDYRAAFSMGLTHLIFFSLEVDPVTHLPTAKDRLPMRGDAATAHRWAAQVGGKTMISFGGNSRSHGFAEMVATKATRTVFLRALEYLLREYHMDGVDYNWEYPRNAEEWRNWALLLKESKETLLGGPEHNVVTFTMYVDPHHADVIQQFKLLDYADYVHCMVYDQPGEHSTYEFAVSAVELAKRKRLPLEKFTLGVPFYARHVGSGEPKTYQEVAKLVKRAERQTKDRHGSYYWNSPEMIRRKTSLAYKSKLGGVMIWELGQDVRPADHPASLMHGIYDALAEHDKGRHQFLSALHRGLGHRKKNDQGSAVLSDDL